MPTQRALRLAKKFKNKLLCEWCNRWNQVPNGVWSDAIRVLHEKGEKYIYFCDRELCMKNRPDGLLSNLTPQRRKNVIWGTVVNDEAYTHKSAHHPQKSEREYI